MVLAACSLEDHFECAMSRQAEALLARSCCAFAVERRMASLTALSARATRELSRGCLVCHGWGAPVVRGGWSGRRWLSNELIEPVLLKAPPRDQRSYRVVKLPNALEVLLGSDPAADTAAAALTLSCGSLQDPHSFPGLAHFHEHMLFLGTERYPEENEYSKYLSEHGGHSNAFTMGEWTTYHFT
eukprot:971587-Amphidinium_carterae.1